MWNWRPSGVRRSIFFDRTARKHLPHGKTPAEAESVDKSLLDDASEIRVTEIPKTNNKNKKKKKNIISA